MKSVEKYSHFNGLEFLLVHKPKLWKEVTDVIKAIDANYEGELYNVVRQGRGVPAVPLVLVGIEP